jgi:hypothetical protein
LTDSSWIRDIGFSRNFLNVGCGPLKKKHRKVAERWLYGALTGTAQLLSRRSKCNTEGHALHLWLLAYPLF